MGLFDRIGREINKGIGAVGGFLGDIVGGAVESFSDPGFQLPTGGFGRKLGGLVGEVGEQLTGQLFGTRTVVTGTAGGRFELGGPGGFRRLPEIGLPLPAPVGSQRLPSVVPPGGGTLPMDLPVPFTFGSAEEAMMATPVALPGGALIGQVLRQVPGVVGGAVLGFQAGQEGGMTPALPFGGTVFRSTPAGLRFRSLVEFQNPITGRKAWYRNVGRPILFSGDLRACRRVNRIGARLRRGRGR